MHLGELILVPASGLLRLGDDFVRLSNFLQRLWPGSCLSLIEKRFEFGFLHFFRAASRTSFVVSSVASLSCCLSAVAGPGVFVGVGHLPALLFWVLAKNHTDRCAKIVKPTRTIPRISLCRPIFAGARVGRGGVCFRRSHRPGSFDTMHPPTSSPCFAQAWSYSPGLNKH